MVRRRRAPGNGPSSITEVSPKEARETVEKQRREAVQRLYLLQDDRCGSLKYAAQSLDDSHDGRSHVAVSVCALKSLFVLHLKGSLDDEVAASYLNIMSALAIHAVSSDRGDSRRGQNEKSSNQKFCSHPHSLLQ